MTTSHKRRLVRSAAAAFVTLLLVAALSGPLPAVRANWGIRGVGPRLEKAGRHEEAAFYYRSVLDFYSANARPWVEFSVYDPRADEVYRRGKDIFEVEKWIGADHEERWDTIGAYLLFFNRDGVARNVEKGNLTDEQRARLEERCRVYAENLIDPDWGWGGDFAFARKAWILERSGLFRDAAYRRELAGRYAINVCSRYCAAVADEMERTFNDRARAKLYRVKAAWWRERALDEMRRADGDRLLAKLRTGKIRRRVERPAVVALLKKGLTLAKTDARLAAVRILADMGELATLESTLKDQNPEVRKAAAMAFAQRMYAPGLTLALKDRSTKVSSIARAALECPAQKNNPQLRRGALAEYFAANDRKPIVTKTINTIDLGLRFRANFPKVWYDYWDKVEVIPESAAGKFHLRVTTKLYIPADGTYSFYVKTNVPSRTRMTLRAPGGAPAEIISPETVKGLQFAAQVGMEHDRIDYSKPIPLRKGLVDIVIDYRGDEIRKIQHAHFLRICGLQRGGIQLLWSSDSFLMEPVAARYLFH